VIRFRSFRTRLLVLILGLVGLSQLAALAIIDRVNLGNAKRDIEEQFEKERLHFGAYVADRNEKLIQGAAAVSFDAGLREALATADLRTTLESALLNLQRRLKADLVALIDLDGRLKAETRSGPALAGIYGPLFEKANNAARGEPTSAYALVDGELFSLVVVPLLAPNEVAWITVGFRLDRTFLNELQQTTDVQLSLRLNGTGAMVREGFVTKELTLPTVGGGTAGIRLEVSLAEKLAPTRRLERVLAGVGAGALVLAALLALLIARSVSEPVRQLAAHTAVIARGDYETRLHLDQADELGQLAAAFNAMSSGLAERDRVRDLLNKNVSPEVAAQLLRDGAALGGEEREVTILFADLRGFTTFSERLAPREVVAQLNRYLDRMSAEIERHGGVIDKFIGDEIMALFGAPVAQPDSADRALAAALAMQAALAGLNAELAAEGKPPMAVGIGINTAHVVAGNIGSHRRLNYSVIGDGVNVAARLQGLTRQASYAATIIVSASVRTAVRRGFIFRALGEATVKGRSESVAVFAVEAGTTAS
jgi:adenylate cyclase